VVAGTHDCHDAVPAGTRLRKGTCAAGLVGLGGSAWLGSAGGEQR
jgi:hypothetical protein